MKIAVIGSRGTLGTAVMSRWNSETVAKYSPNSAPDELFGLDLPEFNVADRQFTFSALAEIRPDLILNVSGIHLIDWVESHPNTARTVHAQGGANLRDAADRIAATLVQIGCAEVFSPLESDESTRTRPWREDDDAVNESVFARTKLDAERAAGEALRHLIVRTSTLFGELGEQSVGNIADTILKSSRRTRELRVIDDIWVSPTWTLDFLRGLRFLIHSGVTGRYHLANQGSATLCEFAQFLLQTCGLKNHAVIGISSAEYGHLVERSKNTALDTNRYHALEGRYPMPDWRTAVREFIEDRQNR